MHTGEKGDNVHILGVAGSLRRESYNAAALRAAQELLPEGTTLEIADISGIPLYNGDVEEAGLPEAVRHLKERIQQADALLLVTPEYNYSIPGVMKNVIDWVSRPPGTSPLTGKPAAIMGASIGYFGTARAQYHLRQVCVFLDMLPLNKPEVFISQAADKFDAAGRLIDARAQMDIRRLLAALRDWTLRLRRGG